jgi:hypothetical protein
MILGLIWSFWCLFAFWPFFFTFQRCFDYLGDFRGILVILQVFGDFFFFCHFRGFMVILIILVILEAF